MATYRAKYTAAERKEIGQKVRRLMTDRGMTGAELARQATMHLPVTSGKKKPVGRDTISWCLTGRSLPEPPTWNAMGRALGTDLNLILPRSHSQKKGELVSDIEPSRERQDFSVKPDGTMDITLVMNVPRAAGLEIMELAMKHGQSRLPK